MEAAKKIRAGEWEFMGWTIENVEDQNGKLSHWNMRPPSEEWFTDSADTLKEAKLMIARWEGQ